eukprot:9000489-Alexandrium_andersonii.AAC.1
MQTHRIKCTNWPKMRKRGSTDAQPPRKHMHMGTRTYRSASADCTCGRTAADLRLAESFSYR